MYSNWKEFRTAWVEALRSDKYQQGVGYLCELKDGQPKYCCLGVAFDLLSKSEPDVYAWRGSHENLFRAEYDGQWSNGMLSTVLTHDHWLIEKLSTPIVSESLESELITRNDNWTNFNDIANYIEEIE